MFNVIMNIGECASMIINYHDLSIDRLEYASIIS